MNEFAWLLYRDAPASEINGLFTTLQKAMNFARTIDPQAVAFTSETGVHYEGVNTLWRIGRMEIQ